VTLRTRLTDKLGIRHPVLLAPMASIAGGRLAGGCKRSGRSRADRWWPRRKGVAGSGICRGGQPTGGLRLHYMGARQKQPATPARADFAVLEFSSGYCRVWSDTALGPEDGHLRRGAGIAASSPLREPNAAMHRAVAMHRSLSFGVEVNSLATALRYRRQSGYCALVRDTNLRHQFRSHPRI
jgi:hypothetical protein